MEGTSGITQTRVTHRERGELGSPPSQNLEVPLLRATGRQTRTTTRAQSRVSQGLARTGARFGERSTFPPRVSGMLIASDVSCSSCRVPCAPAARRLLLEAAGFTARAACSAEPAGVSLLLLRPSGFAADALRRWHRGCFYPLLVPAWRFPPAVAFLAFRSVIRRLRNRSGVP